MTLAGSRRVVILIIDVDQYEMCQMLDVSPQCRVTHKWLDIRKIKVHLSSRAVT